jgi:Fe-S-cluster-containing hydrogenase component 2
MVRRRQDRIRVSHVLCIECGHCVTICPQGAILPAEGEAPPESLPLQSLPGPEETAALLRQRRTIRRYQDRPVERERLEQLVDVARWAPSAANCQCAEYVYLTDERARRQLTDRVVDFYRAYQRALQSDDTPAQLQKLGRARW